MDKLFELAKSVCSEANKYFLEIFSKTKPQIVKIKDANHPVYNFDIEIDAFIRKKLLTTKIQVISEESYNGEHLENIFWLVDPVDGSKEVCNKKSSTINISLIQNGFPLFGVINDIFNSIQYSGISKNINYSFGCFGQLVFNQKMKLITSKLHKNQDDKTFLKVNKFKNIISISSSMKFINISNSKFDIYSRFEGSSGWDTAAGQAIIESNGGQVLNLITLKRLSYSSNSGLRNPPFIAIRNNLRLYRFNKETLEIKLNEINNFSCRKRN